jgi:CGNR zinc finger/Putative stress-induced transcription regulator
MFSHDTEHSLQTIVDLVNTDPMYNDTEGLPDVAALRSFVATHGITHSGRLTNDDVLAVRATRRDFGRFFGLTDPIKAAGLANELIADATVRPRLTNHDGYGWHLHYFSPDASLAEHLVVDGGMSLAQVVAVEEVDRLRICSAPSCQAVLLDLSRNSSKRYCDASTCGNRLHVAAYRQRKRSEQLARRH